MIFKVIDPTKKDAPLVDADAEQSEDSGDDDSDESEEGEEAEEAVAEEDADGNDNDEDDDNEEDSEMDEDPETVTDKLRQRIHEALGDGAALTDTVIKFLLRNTSQILTQN